MLGCIAKKQNKEEEKYIYFAEWINHDRTRRFIFRFSIVQDDNTLKRDFNKLSGLEGQW